MALVSLLCRQRECALFHILIVENSPVVSCHGQPLVLAYHIFQLGGIGLDDKHPRRARRAPLPRHPCPLINQPEAVLQAEHARTDERDILT